MLNLFKKEIQICSPVAGRTQNIESVNDPMFSQKMMGDGIAISPSEGKFYAVESGVLSAFFPTMHAYGITCDNGVEILVHLGIDTVNANGNGFTSTKKQGDRIEKGDLINGAFMAGSSSAYLEKIEPVENIIQRIMKK